MKKQPEITEKTRKKLMDAFWQLYKDNRIEKITVGSITRLAGFNRGTFYEYFTDIYELLDQLEDELLNNVQIELDRIRISIDPDEILTNHKKITEFTMGCAKVFAEYDDTLHVLISQNGDPAFRSKFKKQLGKQLSKVLDMRHMEETEENQEYLLSFLLSSITGLLDCWYEMGKKTSIEELLKKMQVLIFQGVFGYYGITVERE